MMVRLISFFCAQIACHQDPLLKHNHNCLVATDRCTFVSAAPSALSRRCVACRHMASDPLYGLNRNWPCCNLFCCECQPCFQQTCTMCTEPHAWSSATPAHALIALRCTHSPTQRPLFSARLVVPNQLPPMQPHEQRARGRRKGRVRL